MEEQNPMNQLEFYFDFLSPYAYLAWHQLPKLLAADSKAVSIETKPVLLGALLAHGKTLGPAEIPAKRDHVIKDVLRLADQFALPLVPPSLHPFNPLLPLRVAHVVPASMRSQFVSAAFNAVWSLGGAIETPDDLEPIVRAIGLNADEVIGLANAPQGKQALHAATADAIRYGVFGVPTFRVLGPGEIFFGCDSLPHLLGYLAGKDPLTTKQAQSVLARWSDIKPSPRVLRNTQRQSE